MTTQLAPHVRALVERLERELPNDAGFLSALESARERLGRLPETREIELDATREPLERPPAPAEARELLDGIRGWLYLLCDGQRYLLRHLLDSVVSGLNEGDHLTTVFSARGILERAARVHDVWREVEPRAAALFVERGGEGRLQSIAHCHRVLFRYAAAARFNWEAAAGGDLDAFFEQPQEVRELLKATNIQTMIGKIPQERKGDVDFYYGLLSDVGHPNGPSNELAIDAIRDVPGGRRRFSLAFRQMSEDSFARIVHLVAIPVRSSLVLLEGELDELEGFAKKLGDRTGPWPGRG